jgi:hypothetical protein
MKKRIRVRRIRRLANARVRTGKKIVQHKIIGGRTGKIHSTKLKGMKSKDRTKGLEQVRKDMKKRNLKYLKI